MMKEQLVEMTGLSPRVIRVWFQNKRCKDKKKSIQMKQQQGSRGVSSPEDQVRKTTQYELFIFFVDVKLYHARTLSRE
jgi:non-ribosomal peptide synthetase component E (peptide arylation enzyme)